MTWKLETITGEFTGKEISIERDMLVGRHQDADLLLQAAEISRRHAAFLLKEDALYVQDLKSSNGTFVNDARIEHETLLKEGDIVQFASQKFAVLAPAVAVEKPVETVAVPLATPAVEIEQAIINDVKTEAQIQQPSEAVATSEAAQGEIVQPKTVAEQMIEQGMPDLKERDSAVQVTREGMPQNVGIPKPAPIPEGVDLTATPVKHEACEVEIPAACQQEEAETQKNASIGLMALLAIIFVAIIGWLIFK